MITDYQELFTGYPVNRKLTEEERRNQFKQKERLEVTPFYNFTVIRMNSSYLECVDRWFRDRGEFTWTMLLAAGFILWAMIILPLFSDLTAKQYLGWIVFYSPIWAASWAAIYWAIKKESFCWTHYPIRFDYRNRMVYVFQKKGDVLKVRWDDIFFTMGRSGSAVDKQNWDIRGHILDADGETVLQTFVYPGDSLIADQLKHGWEFFRRYMEEGAASIYGDVFWCHDIVNRRETYWEGETVMSYMLNGQPVFQGLLAPWLMLCAVGRWFSMKTSKIPVWPEEIEAQCKIEPNDPYVRDASNNPRRIPRESIGEIKAQLKSEAGDADKREYD